MDDPASAAGKLTARYATLSELLSADPAVIDDYAGSGSGRAIAATHALMVHALQDNLRRRRHIGNDEYLARLLKILIGFRNEEHLVVLFLDARQGLIDHETIAIGTADGVELDQRRILLRAIGRGASGMIVAHNHPSGDPRPSATDMRATRALADAGRALGICLHDHLVIAGGDVQSAMCSS